MSLRVPTSALGTTHILEGLASVGAASGARHLAPPRPGRASGAAPSSFGLLLARGSHPMISCLVLYVLSSSMSWERAKWLAKTKKQHFFLVPYMPLDKASQSVRVQAFFCASCAINRPNFAACVLHITLPQRDRNDEPCKIAYNA